MDLNEYQRIITSPERQGALSSVENRLALTGLGLSGEAGEVNDLLKKIYFHGLEWNEDRRIKIELELGDVLWYAGFGAHALGIELESLRPSHPLYGKRDAPGDGTPLPKGPAARLGMVLARAVGIAAANISDDLGEEYDPADLRTDLFPSFCGVVSAVLDLVYALEFTEQSVMDANLAKLAKRYPTGFTTGAAKAHHERSGL